MTGLAVLNANTYPDSLRGEGVGVGLSASDITKHTTQPGRAARLPITSLSAPLPFWKSLFVVPLAKPPLVWPCPDSNHCFTTSSVVQPLQSLFYSIVHLPIGGQGSQGLPTWSQDLGGCP